MKTIKVSNLDQTLAKVCENCPVCRSASRNPSGLANRFVRRIEEQVCPFCRAYERVHGRKAHEDRERQ